MSLAATPIMIWLNRNSIVHFNKTFSKWKCQIEILHEPVKALLFAKKFDNNRFASPYLENTFNYYNFAYAVVDVDAPSCGLSFLNIFDFKYK